MEYLLIIVGVLLVLGAAGGLLYTFLVYDHDGIGYAGRREKLYDKKYSTDMNRFSARKEAEASLARTELQDQLNAEGDALLYKESKDAEMEVASAQNTNTVVVLEEASILKLPVETYAEVEKHRLMTLVDLEKNHAEKREIVRIAMLGKELSEHQRLALLQELVDNCYIKIAEFQKLDLPQSIIDRMIADKEEEITFTKGDMHARRSGLAQISDGENIRGNLSLADPGRSDSEPT